MSKPSICTVHVSRPLTNISIAYMNRAGMFISDRVFPQVPVMKQADRYWVYNKGDWHRIEAKKRAACTESAGAGYGLDNTPSYFADVYGVHKDVCDQIRANADSPLDMDRDATEFVTHNILLLREKIWVNNYFQTTIWTNERAGVAAAPVGTQFLRWDDASSTPIEDICNASISMAQLTGYKPNTLVLSPSVLCALKNHPDIIDRVKYTQRGVITEDILAALFDVERVFIPYAIENTAAEGQTDAFSFMYGKHALLAYSAPRPSLLQPSAGYTFTWTGLLGAGALGMRIKRFRMEHLEADRIEGELAFDMKVVAADLGFFFKDAVS